mgnify:CR=1 FL=1
MRILITGGAGFIGSHIAEIWQNKAEVIILDNLRTGRRENLENLKVNFVEGDIRERGLVFELTKGIDIIYHEAALVSVIESIQNPSLTEEINIYGLRILLEAARHNGVKRVVFTSSAAVYGDNGQEIQREEYRPRPLSPYAISKIVGEYYLEMYNALYGLSTVSLRNFNVYGPRQDPFSPYASVIPIFICRALQGKELIIYGDGEQTRDFIYVKDIAAANLMF